VLIDDEVHPLAQIGQEWQLPRVRQEIEEGADTVSIIVDGQERSGKAVFTEHERELLLAGGLLRYLKRSARGG